MRKDGIIPKLELELPAQEASIKKFLYPFSSITVFCSLFPQGSDYFVTFEHGRRTESGTFRHEDLLVNKDGLRIVSHGKEGEVAVVFLCCFFLACGVSVYIL